jgi:tetratricopeptide (TPR) repeat protein
MPRPPPESTPAPVATDAGVVESVDALLEAADQARLEGRGDDAISLIERALAGALDPGREVVAAFALAHARNSRGEHALAAQAFARAFAADAEGALAEDALAREAEAWSRANEPKRAREAARRYQARYPHGRRSQLVRELGVGD